MNAADESRFLLTKIEEALRLLGRTTALGALQQGIAPEAVRSRLACEGLDSRDELESLYAWRNGISPGGATIGELALIPGYYLLSLEDAIANYRAFVIDSRWRVGWFPLLADGGGWFYVLDLSGRGQAPIRHFRLEEVEHPIEYDSLHSLLRTIAAAFDENVMFVDQDGYLEMDCFVFNEFAARLNPHVDWWKN